MKMWQLVGTCLFVGIASGYLAKINDRSPWLWGALGFFVLGLIVHTLVGVLVFFFFA